MILTPYTVVAFFLAGLGAVLALIAAGAGLRAAGVRNREEADDRSHLLVLLAGTLLLVRGLAWPHFHLLLESYVPVLAPSGVMCAYGVTQLEPELVRAIFWGKPAALALLGGWLALAFVERKSDRPVFGRLLPALLAPVALAAGAECAIEGAWLLADKLEQPVTCCTQAFDLEVERRAGGADPFALAGFATPAWTFASWVAAQLGAAAVAWLGARHVGRPRGAWSRLLAALLAAACLPLALWAWTDFVAPRVLGLPYHHCVLEVLTRAPAMGLAALFTVGGGVAVAGMAPLLLLRRRAPAEFDELERRADRGGALLLVSALWIAAIHLV